MTADFFSTRKGTLVLSDGETFEGTLWGAETPAGIVCGEVVFNTVLSGYQEVITDPSYAGQIVTFTYPHLGNYGVNKADSESDKPHLRGVICRDVPRVHSNWRASQSLNDYLVAQGVCAISDIDTRRLTRHIRAHGSLSGAFGNKSVEELHLAAQNEPGTSGIDLAATVTTAEVYERGYEGPAQPDGEAPAHIVAMDFGIKNNIIAQLAQIARVTVVPADTSAEEITALKPDGVFLSNGPGNPDKVMGSKGPVTNTIAELLGKTPVFGICLGHQLIALTVGLDIYKLAFGHHGGNHPVRNIETGAVEITSQNHNFCVAEPTEQQLKEAGFELTHINLNDHTVAGIASKDGMTFSVQYHPEAAPGPHDSNYLFYQFQQSIQIHQELLAAQKTGGK